MPKFKVKNKYQVGHWAEVTAGILRKPNFIGRVWTNGDLEAYLQDIGLIFPDDMLAEIIKDLQTKQVIEILEE